MNWEPLTFMIIICFVMFLLMPRFWAIIGGLWLGYVAIWGLMAFMVFCL